MKISENIKKILMGIVAVVVIVFCAISFLTSDLEHIEDTNGPDDYSLTTITDENIINMDTGSLGGPEIRHTEFLGNSYEFSAKKFTGVYEILYDNFIGKSDFVLDLSSFEVYEGNFRMVVVYDGEIIETIEPGTNVNYILENITGTVSLRIAGESASFSFGMSGIDYDMHSHT